MRKNEKNTGVRFGASGISLILVLFGIVAMLLLAVLSLSAAQASLRLSKRYLSSEENYAAAKTDEASTLATLSTLLASGKDEETALSEAGFSREEDGTWSISLSCGESQALTVVVTVSEGRYTIVSETTGSTSDVTYDTSLPVLKKSSN
ncbi:MAG: hypothetical protein ACI4OJ_02030 [Lachnospiraceae bacterium]